MSKLSHTRPSRLLAQLEDTQEKPVHFVLDSKSYKEMKHYIAEHNISMKELMTKALHEYINK